MYFSPKNAALIVADAPVTLTPVKKVVPPITPAAEKAWFVVVLKLTDTLPPYALPLVICSVDCSFFMYSVALVSRGVFFFVMCSF